MSFHRINMNTYPRKEYYEYYMRFNVTYSATVQIDITELKAAIKRRGLKAYPAQIWILSDAVNCFPEFRMGLDEDGNLGYCGNLSPMYTVLPEGSQKFSTIWTEFSLDFATFYHSYLSDVKKYADGTFMPQTDMPYNLFNVSSIPWVDFTAFHLNLPSQNFFPIFTIGKYIERDGKTYMPLAIQVHHAVCDGYHLGQFVEKVRQLVADSDQWFIV